MKKESQQEKDTSKKVKKAKNIPEHKRIMPMTKIVNKQVVKYF